MDKSIEQILQEAGFQTVTGVEAVLTAIKEVADGSTQPRCSGYRVFPGGARCPGCGDCNG